MGNPYTLTFGKPPVEYVGRREYVDIIESTILGTPARSNTFLIRGVRGSGKTVLMTVISKEIEKKDDWICVDLNSAQDLLEDLSYRLADAYDSALGILDRGLDISVAGFGIGIGGKENRDSVSRCEEILKSLKKHNKKLLITIDEVINDQSMKKLASQFQIWIRKDFPIFLLMTGLFENINAIQNNPQLTFLLRSPKISLEPLSLSQIARQYEKTLNVSRDTGLMLANQTKGYAFAFQALGMICYDNKNVNFNEILDELDGYLDEYVYQKIWSSLSEQEKSIIIHLSDENPVKVKDICQATDMTSQTFSKYRERLKNKGLINTEQHGYVNLALPRFQRICSYYGGIG